MPQFVKVDPPKKQPMPSPALTRMGNRGIQQIPILQQPTGPTGQPNGGAGHAFGRISVYAGTDATYVKVQTGEEFLQRLDALNQAAVLADKAAWEARQQTVGPGPAEVKRKEDMAAQETLKKQFGTGWGAFFWLMRGGGQTGEASPIWGILGAASSLNKGYPIPRYFTAPRIYPSQLPKTYLTAQDR